MANLREKRSSVKEFDNLCADQMVVLSQIPAMVSAEAEVRTRNALP